MITTRTNHFNPLTVVVAIALSAIGCSGPEPSDSLFGSSNGTPSEPKGTSTYDTVSAATVSTSESYKLLSVMGQPIGDRPVTGNESYRLQRGLVGKTGSPQ